MKNSKLKGLDDVRAGSDLKNKKGITLIALIITIVLNTFGVVVMN